MKKFVAVIGIFLVLLSVVSVFGSFARWGKDLADGPMYSESGKGDNVEDVYTVEDVYEITLSKETVEIGERGKTICIQGIKEKSTFLAKGEGNGTIRASEGGMLIVKNLTIEDKRTNAYTNAHSNYLRFGGKVRFENCTFKDVIYVKDNAEAEFVNCSFNSPKSKYYAVWVGDGSASFEGCTFTGYRGLKIHEFEEEDEDVTSVTVNNCEFRDLKEKVGIAIGVFYVNPLETVVRITNSRFINNQAWDTVGSLAGVDSFYETDMYVNEYAFFEEKNVIEFTPMSDDDYWTPNY